MNPELKNQIGQSLEVIKEKLKQWKIVYNIAQDIIAYINRDVRRFRIEIDLAVGMRFIRTWIVGTDRYVYYGESASELSLKQIYERFLEDDEALVNMVKKLAEAVAEIADEKIEEFEEQLKE
jgi:hypothetical protein